MYITEPPYFLPPPLTLMLITETLIIWSPPTPWFICWLLRPLLSDPPPPLTFMLITETLNIWSPPTPWFICWLLSPLFSLPPLVFMLISEPPYFLPPVSSLPVFQLMLLSLCTGWVVWKCGNYLICAYPDLFGLFDYSWIIYSPSFRD